MSLLYESVIEVYGMGEGVVVDELLLEMKKRFGFDGKLDGKQDEWMALRGQHTLWYDESVDKIIRQIVKLIWDMNGAYCNVTVNTLCLDTLPYEFYDFDEDDYNQKEDKK